jgi:hypothetical protein
MKHLTRLSAPWTDSRPHPIDAYGDNVKTAAGVPGGTFMHVHKSLWLEIILNARASS